MITAVLSTVAPEMSLFAVNVIGFGTFVIVGVVIVNETASITGTHVVATHDSVNVGSENALFPMYATDTGAVVAGEKF